MNHRRAALYLQIPAAYCRSFGGLRWAQYGEAIEFLEGPDAGRTFAFAAEVGHFLEGLLSAEPGGPCPAFGTALHLLYMLGLGDRATDSERAARFRKERLARPFRELGSPLRNAGALCAWIYRDLAGVADPPELPELLRLLNGGSWIPQMVLTHPMLGAMDYAEQPAADPSVLDAAVDAALSELSDEAIRHWLKFGRDAIAEADRVPLPLPPPGTTDTLTRVEQRPRLAGMRRLVSRLEGALSLPPRRLEHDGPQTDGYSDLATRGAPEQILPIQFALEDEEFLRRFAERELLYFHRERPSRAVTQEVVLVLDQGVRTWGDVRLVLAGAALAMARQAARRELAVRLATTGLEEGPVDPSRMEADALGELLEASDFTANPARSLARVLRDGPGVPRDVVLLTHPRSIDEAEVVEAAGRLEPGDPTRVFAVTAAPDGQVELSALRRGRPVAIVRCRVDLSGPPPAAEPPPRRGRAVPRGPWRGPVEPIPFPFRCGLLGPLIEADDPSGRVLDFDEAGGRVLVALRNGIPCTFEVDGTDSEILPRPIAEAGEVMRPVKHVIGVAGGFVAIGPFRSPPSGLVLAHYDFPTRTCRVHSLRRFDRSKGVPTCLYYADLHSVVLVRGGGSQAIDVSAAVDAAEMTSRATRAAERARAGIPPYPRPDVELETSASERWIGPTRRAAELDAATGTLRYDPGFGEMRTVRPMADGVPAMIGSRIVTTQQGGDVLAVQAESRSALIFWFISMSRAAVIGSFSYDGDGPSRGTFALSRDGRRFARRLGDDRVEVRDVPGDRPPVLVTPAERGWFHFASLGRSCLLVREFDQAGARRPHAHALIRWDGGRLAVNVDDPVAAFEQMGGPVAESRSVMPRSLPHGCDRVRFYHMIEHGRLKVLIDLDNHLAVLGPDDRLIAMFYLSGKEYAAWAPGGQGMGSRRLIGEPSPNASALIGSDLWAAERGEGGYR